MSSPSKASSIKSSESLHTDLERNEQSAGSQAEKQDLEQSRYDDWDGPDDPGSPLNWPSWKRHYHTAILTGAATVCTIASSVYAPAVQTVAEDFAISKEEALLPFSLYILGLGFGPVIAAPVSETYGRKCVYLTTLPLFSLFTLGAGFSRGVASLTVLRFLAGVFAGPSVAIGSAIIADIYRPSGRAIPMTLYIATIFCAPAIAPLIGGYATEYRGWQWTMWSTLMIAAAVILMALPMQETFKTKILQKRARKHGVNLPSSGETISQFASRFVKTVLFRPIHMGFTEPIVAFVAIYISINFATLYSFYAAFPSVLNSAYGFSIGQVGISFLSIGVGAALAAVITLTMQFRVFNVEARANGKVTAEKRLYLAMMASVMLPASLFWLAWTTRPEIHWICPIIAEVVFSCGNMLAFMSFVLYITDTYGARYTASAMSANTFLRYLFACVFPLWITYMYDGLGTGWATTVLGFLSLLMSPVPWVFYKCGPRLRARSGYGGAA